MSAKEALHEAKRCLSCGNCFECDNCYAACPEDAIIKLGPNEGYEIKLDLCTGCGICVEQCPCHAMEMVVRADGGQDMNAVIKLNSGDAPKPTTERP